MSSPLPRRSFPCNECPWRRDTPPGQFTPERYAALRSTSEHLTPTSPQDIFRQPVFACHKGEPGTNEDLACAGWLAVAGGDHIGMRLAASQGRLPHEALSPGNGWPELFDSYDEMARVQGCGSAKLADHTNSEGR